MKKRVVGNLSNGQKKHNSSAAEDISRELQAILAKAKLKIDSNQLNEITRYLVILFISFLYLLM